MAIAAINLERRRGDTYADEFQVISETTGQPIDISAGYTFLLTVDPLEHPPDPAGNLFQLTGSVVDGPNGLVEFAPSDAQADEVGSYFYDVQMTNAGRKRTIAAGRYGFVQDVTKT
jgi:hypothetical protein